MSRRAACIEVPARLTKPKQPYPGLRPFEPDEWPIFFGRDRMVDEVIDRLARDRLVFVHGSSGSGKSSLVRAGVLPRLASEQRREGGTWRGCLMRPSGGPMWNLARAFATLEGRGDDLDRAEEIIRRFSLRNATLSSVAASLDGAADEKICILVDQFEELFRFAKETSREEAEIFVDLLTREIGEGNQRGAAHVIITMRSEFLGECARFDKFAELINRTQYLVPRIERAELARAVSRPAELYGGAVARDFAERLIAEVRGRRDELPLIQHALMLTWNEAAARTRKDETILLDARLLDKAGSLEALLSGHVDRVLAEAAPDEKRLRAAEQIFRALTDINAEGQAIRRPQTLGELVAVCGGLEFEADVREILDAFRAEGVSFLTPYTSDPIEAKTVIDIGHESVIRCWGKIADKKEGWLEKEFRDGQVWRSLVVQAKRFERTNSDLLSQAATGETEHWLSERSAQWANRYGGEWKLVDRLVQKSVQALTKTDQQRSQKVIELRERLIWTESNLESKTNQLRVSLWLVAIMGIVAFVIGFAWPVSSLRSSSVSQDSPFSGRLITIDR